MKRATRFATDTLQKSRVRAVIVARPGLRISDIARQLGMSYSSVTSTLVGMEDVCEDNNRLYIVDWRSYETPRAR